MLIIIAKIVSNFMTLSSADHQDEGKKIVTFSDKFLGRVIMEFLSGLSYYEFLSRRYLFGRGPSINSAIEMGGKRTAGQGNEDRE